jgi:MFS superfamily sulfate permease-like transporter
MLTVPLAIYWHIRETEPSYSLVSIGDFWGSIQIHFNTQMIGQFVFWKYVFMFLFVNSLESLLTVKAIDNLDPQKRTSSFNGDLLSVGAGNLASGLLGGLPMISEVVRSSSNLAFGAKSKWSNFFHGVFLLLAMILLIPIIEMIPNAALAAMLIYAGYRLAAPSQFVHALHIGKEQLAIFLITIIVTLAEDLLLGIAAGILVKFLFHLYNGAKVGNLFKARYQSKLKDELLFVTIYDAAIFSNLIGFKKVLDQAHDCKKVIIDFNHCKLIDHSFMAFIHHAQNRFEAFGGEWQNIGLSHMRPLSHHELATRKFDKNSNFHGPNSARSKKIKFSKSVSLKSNKVTNLKFLQSK